MSLITVKRDNEKVTVLVSTDLAHNCSGTDTASIPLTWQMTYPYEADLLARYLDKRIKDFVKEARRESYEQGWKDARSKKAKQDWFSGVL